MMEAIGMEYRFVNSGPVSLKPTLDVEGVQPYMPEKLESSMFIFSMG